MTSSYNMMDNIENLVENLKNFEASESLDFWNSMDYASRGAVLVLLYKNRHGQLTCVMTVRSYRMRSYPGQAAFPGGKCDANTETGWETALREADEEIGFKWQAWGDRFHKLCQMPVFLSRNKMLVLPCVAYLSGDGITLDQVATEFSIDEVAGAYTVDIVGLYEKLHIETERVLKLGNTWYNHTFRIYTRAEDVEVIAVDPVFAKNDYTDIVGLTSNMILDVARVALGKNPTYDHLCEIGFEKTIRRNLNQLFLVFQKRAMSEKFLIQEGI